VGMLRKHTSWSRVVVRAWIIIWMLAVPLFHVHPEADHHHGEAGHIHGGTVHTVFSPDLEGEFGHHQSTTAAVEQPTATQFTLSVLHFHASDYTELGFSFVSDSTDRTLPKPLVSSALIVEPPAQTPLAANPSVIQPLAHSLPLTLLTHDIPARAPPSLLV
jgi:hypothetical protein